MECPTCGEDFDSILGLKTHDGMVHEGDISWTTLKCDRCGDQFEKRKYMINDGRNFCSDECYQDSKKKVECSRKKCNESYSVYNYRLENGRGKYCSLKCKKKDKREGQYFNCINCGDEFYRRPSEVERSACNYCSITCMNDDLSGEKHPNWKGDDAVYLSYRGAWRRKREERLEEDNYICQECGGEKNLHVHHIIRYKDFEDPFEANETNNLITLCEGCHMSYENCGEQLDCISNCKS